MRLFFPAASLSSYLSLSSHLPLSIFIPLLPINLLLSLLPRCPRCPRQYSAGIIGLHRQPTTNFSRLLPLLPANSPSSNLFYRIVIFPTKQVPSLLNWSSFIWASWFLLSLVFHAFSLRRDVATLRRRSAAASILTSSFPALYRRFLV